jgi:two-component system, sporulation sensor kinase B
MIVLFAALWTIAAILIFTDYKTPSTRWGSAVAFFSGFGGLTIVLRDNILPVINDSNLKSCIHLSISFMLTLSYQMAPYALIVYSIRFTGFFKKYPAFYKFVPYIFFTPVAIMYLVFPCIPDYTPPYLFLSIWVIPYILFSDILLFISYINEKTGTIKLQRLLICVLIIPTTLFSMVSNYISGLLNMSGLWEYNTITIVAAFVIFIITSAKYGSMGVRLKFEKHLLNSTMKALTSGTTILNHSIKNEICKISMCMNNIKISANKPDADIQDVNENIQIVLDSTNHLTAMMKRIQEQVREIVLIESNNDLADIVGKSLEMVKPFIESKKISVNNNLNCKIELHCDRVHMMEVFINIFKNAIEAMQTGGILDISFSENKKEIVLAVKDDGVGIPKANLPYIFDPFFSTKQRTMNFGLGLSYCYNVIQKHGGRLDIQSAENAGTTMFVCFPKTKVLKTTDNLHQRSTVHG